jgi:hypothetical protein
MKRHHEHITTASVYVEEDRHLPIDPARVEAQAASIKEIGLIEPILSAVGDHYYVTVMITLHRVRFGPGAALGLQPSLSREARKRGRGTPHHGRLSA